MANSLTLRVLCLILFVVAPAFADDAPVLSGSGRTKTEGYLKVLQMQASDLQVSLDNVRKNIATVRGELTQLDSLEKEDLAILQRAEAYVRSAEPPVEKNEAALREGAGTPATEREERLRWKKENEPKLMEARKTLGDVRKRLADLGARRGPLTSQLRSWTQREKDYERALTSTQTRRAELERLYRGSPNSVE